MDPVLFIFSVKALLVKIDKTGLAGDKPLPHCDLAWILGIEASRWASTADGALTLAEFFDNPVRRNRAWSLSAFPFSFRWPK